MKKYGSWHYAKINEGIKMARVHNDSIEDREMNLFERIILRLFKRKLYKYSMCFKEKR